MNIWPIDAGDLSTRKVMVLSGMSVYAGRYFLVDLSKNLLARLP